MTATILRRRNRERSDELRTAPRDLTPAMRTIIITCADHRVDPAHIFGLGLGEAVVLRNPGGRVTRDIIRSLMVLSTVGQIEGVKPGFEILVLHHTDCGVSRLDSPDHAPLVAEFVGVSVEDVPGLSVTDPRRSAIHDAELLAELVNSDESNVVAAVYDLESGIVELLN